MNKFIAILGLAFIPVLSPLTGQAQQTKGAVTAKSVSDLHRSRFALGKLSTREGSAFTYVDGEITNNAKKEAKSVYISVRWFDKNDKVIAQDTAHISDLEPAETLPFHAFTKKNPEITRYDTTIKSVY